ncbi:MAG: hypothetical protein JWQ74_1045 [Marmoricola sp.]|nr:hypothetical protein [Marmoricola sp.]
MTDASIPAEKSAQTEAVRAVVDLDDAQISALAEALEADKGAVDAGNVLG